MRIHLEQRVDAPKEDVWKLLADFGGIAAWNTGLTDSRVIAGPSRGVGSERRCDAGRVYLQERVVEWEEGQLLGLEWTRLPVPGIRGDFSFHLRSDGAGTWVRVAGRTQGPLAWLWTRSFRTALRGVLRDLAQAAARQKAVQL